MKTDDIRTAFLDFFKSNAHTIVPTDSLVPCDDPSLLFTSAGMNQFKRQFLGSGISYRRAASCQKCLRTADLENVGRTNGHHTFFEMLGNFSFGDYFKKEAISWAWEFLTRNLRLKAERLWVSVYKDDDEAYNIWSDVIKIPREKIVKLGEKENFWPSEAPTAGPNGPCGPCSEIFYDYGKGTGCGRPDCTPQCDCGRFIEVWNMVFTQFDRQSDGSLRPLPNKNIDTGMGLERLASVMQGVGTNFEIDIFLPIVKAIESHSAAAGGINDKPRPRPDAQRTARSRINAVADHIRAVTFAIADGVMPSNEERGYVVRKLIRRATIHAQGLGIKEPFLYKLVSVVGDVMKGPYPELTAKRDDVAGVVKQEEENFLFIIKVQFPKVEEAFEKIRKSGNIETLADAAFNFYDTYGMPYDMLEDIAERLDLKIDKVAFDNLLDKQRERSRAKTAISKNIFADAEIVNYKTEFLGYEQSRLEARILYVGADGPGVKVILDRTPFYGSSGGQAGDRGTIETESGLMNVEYAKREGDRIDHVGRLVKGTISKGQAARVSIDKDVRKKIMANHTATHLLHAALRKVLGGHVRQMGSLVDAGHLRFDFAHMKKMQDREIARVEEIVNENIKNAVPVSDEIKDLESARRDGAMALFGEKYGARVRVVSVGDMSKELCGGTHVSNTKDVGIFKITGESSIASGVRRIEALTGGEAKRWIDARETARIQKLDAESEKAKAKEAADRRLKEEIDRLDSIISSAVVSGGAKIMARIVDDMNIENLRVLSDRIRQKERSGIVILSTRTASGVLFIVALSETAVQKGLSAGDIAKELSKSIGGSGGGRADFAQGGGRDSAALDGALENVVNSIKERLCDEAR